MFHQMGIQLTPPSFIQIYTMAKDEKMKDNLILHFSESILKEKIFATPLFGAKRENPKSYELHVLIFVLESTIFMLTFLPQKTHTLFMMLTSLAAIHHFAVHCLV